MRKIFVLSLIIGLLACCGVAEAKYPERPINFIIGWAIGGGSDQAGRSLCMYAEKELGKPFAIQNITGGSGAKAYMNIAKSKADGYTIGLTTSTISTLKTMGTIPLGTDDFEHIIMFNSDPGGIWVHKDAPWKTLKEFLDYAKANPGKVSVAASNPGSITRFEMMALESAADVRFRVLAQQGGAAKGLVALAGKHIDAAMGTPLEGYALYQAGQIRPLGWSSAERVGMMPDVPTWKESGYDVVIATSRTVIAPKGTPKEIIDTLYKAFSNAVNNPTYRANMEKMGSNVHDLTPEQTKSFLSEQNATFKKIIDDAGLGKKAK